MNKRSWIGYVAAALCIAALGSLPQRAPADNVVYEFTALRGDVSGCQWFNENLNDRAESSLVRQTDMLYNRLALPPDAPVNVTQTATTTAGTQLAGFTLNRTMLCAGIEAIRPPVQPSTAP